MLAQTPPTGMRFLSCIFLFYLTIFIPFNISLISDAKSYKKFKRAAAAALKPEKAKSSGNCKNSNQSKQTITIGAIFKDDISANRSYGNALFTILNKDYNERNEKWNCEFVLSATWNTIKLPLSPQDILNLICKQFIPAKVAAILFITADEKYGQATASKQYLIHLMSYTGIPILAFNADNSGILTNRDFNEFRLLQLAPPLEHQVLAMLKILDRYQWKKFSIITSEIVGADRFVQICKQMELQSYEERSKFKIKFEIVEIEKIATSNTTEAKLKLQNLYKGETRIILLYATKIEAKVIFEIANKIGLLEKEYVWIVSQSVVGEASPLLGNQDFPEGLLGVHFHTAANPLISEINSNIFQIENAVQVFVSALQRLVQLREDRNEQFSFVSNASCQSHVDYFWKDGSAWFNALKQAKVYGDTGMPNDDKYTISFTHNGRLKIPNVQIVNLVDAKERNMQKLEWNIIGKLSGDELIIKDIVWLKKAPQPARGLPEKYHLRVVTLDEKPFVIVSDIDAKTGNCSSSRGVKCRWGQKMAAGENNEIEANHNETIWKCCSGLCIDLLDKLAKEVGFTYDLYKVEDGLWGIHNASTDLWNGLIADLLENRADMCATSLKMNSHRVKVIDYSVPWLDTGISIVVAVRRGALSPTAFLEPFDYKTWLVILICGIHGVGFFIFLFEFLSPAGYNMQIKTPPGHKFSLFRVYWLVWASLFATSVTTNVPRSHTARFMALVWAGFSLVFGAVYTANLAAFMITRTSFHDLKGIKDEKIVSPESQRPVFRYGTVKSGNTEATLRVNYGHLWRYIDESNSFKDNISNGIDAVKHGDLDAFIYDAVALDFLTAKDDDCGIVTVGKWFSMTGYGFGFPKHSKWTKLINDQIMKMHEKGDLERLTNFWITGACSKGGDRKTHSVPLNINQFISAFLLLAAGTVIGLSIMCWEYIYCKFIRQKLAGVDKAGLCGLLSLSMLKSLTIEEVAEKVHQRNRIQKFKSLLLRNQKEERFENELTAAKKEVQVLRESIDDEIRRRSSSLSLLKKRPTGNSGKQNAEYDFSEQKESTI